MKQNFTDDLPQHLEVEFSALQMDLPLGSHHHFSAPDMSPRPGPWVSPARRLADYLGSVGVAQPDQIACSLLREFGSVSELLAASWWRIQRAVGGRLASTLLHSRDLVQAALGEGISRGPILGSRQDIADFLKSHLGALQRERVIALYVDQRLHLLRFEQIADGNVRGAALDLAKVVHMGLDAGAAGLFLVHNHPSGDASPSEDDRRVTARLERIMGELDMYLLDHLIVAGGEVRSIMRG